MNGKARLSIAAIVWASACVGLGGPPSPDGLGYRVPSPPTATYHVADTIVVESRPFQQVREYTTTTAITLRMTFERDPDGVRVIGIPESFEGAVRGGIVTRGPPPGLDDVTGALEFVLNPHGEVDVVSLPEFSGTASGLGRIASIAHELFPRLPDRVVEPGATWVDTVTWSSVGPVVGGDVHQRSYLHPCGRHPGGRSLRPEHRVGRGGGDSSPSRDRWAREPSPRVPAAR